MVDEGHVFSRKLEVPWNAVRARNEHAQVEGLVFTDGPLSHGVDDCHRACADRGGKFHMRSDFSTRSEAQAFADAIHQRMISQDTAYAASVTAKQTTGWAVPYQDRDDDGKPIGTKWYVNLKDRCDQVLQPSERTALKPYATKAEAQP